MLPNNLNAVIKKGTWPVLPIFDVMQKLGNLTEHDMYNTFNMGIGMIVAVDKNKADEAIKILKSEGEDAYVIGELTNGTGEVEIV